MNYTPMAFPVQQNVISVEAVVRTSRRVVVGVPVSNVVMVFEEGWNEPTVPVIPTIRVKKSRDANEVFVASLLLCVVLHAVIHLTDRPDQPDQPDAW